jgi:hypothetical protein
MIKRLERLKNTVNKYMIDLRPTSQNGSWSCWPVYFLVGMCCVYPCIVFAAYRKPLLLRCCPSLLFCDIFFTFSLCVLKYAHVSRNSPILRMQFSNARNFACLLLHRFEIHRNLHDIFNNF